MPVTIDEQPRYITTSALKNVMQTLDNEIQAVSVTVTALNDLVQTNSATWNSVTGKQDKIDFEYKEMEM
jgi:hypothetical protein